MNRKLAFAGVAVAAGAALAAGPLLAAADRVTSPAGFATDWVLYNQVDRHDRNTVRHMYVNPEAWAAAVPGQPAPDGTILVMADKAAQLDAAGNPVLDENGRFIPTGEFTAIFVMEKRAGWGETLGLDVIRNGDWDYARFNLDRTLRAETNTTGCFACHAPRAEEDFTYTFFRNVIDDRG